MSRVGKKPIPIPPGVKVRHRARLRRGQGSEGDVAPAPAAGSADSRPPDDELLARLVREDAALGKFHGLARSLVANAVHGVSQGFKKELDIVGIGYRAEHTGKQVVFALGYSHSIEFDIPADVEIAVDKQTHLTVSGMDRQRVGQVAADIRALRKPDPYKQKGVRYTGEVLKKKVGKTGA